MHPAEFKDNFDCPILHLAELQPAALSTMSSSLPAAAVAFIARRRRRADRRRGAAGNSSARHSVWKHAIDIYIDSLVDRQTMPPIASVCEARAATASALGAEAVTAALVPASGLANRNHATYLLQRLLHRFERGAPDHSPRRAAQSGEGKPTGSPSSSSSNLMTNNNNQQSDRAPFHVPAAQLGAWRQALSTVALTKPSVVSLSRRFAHKRATATARSRKKSQEQLAALAPPAHEMVRGAKRCSLRCTPQYTRPS